ncbi:aggrecan core protein-like [Triplophysa dalaica]|uniref:aggrecan core protein-like n=1 Tax=Triplophysa dalaica TaxID=1582913 RepID=UPI0024DFD5F8|nr:aggrecan core protein-like [Triplophysa dalaica]
MKLSHCTVHGGDQSPVVLEIVSFLRIQLETTGYILITDRKNWRDAQSHCRQYHTDLASIHSLEEQNQIRIVSEETRWVWIGLSTESWQWSDQWSLSFTNWAAGQPSASGDCVAMSTTDSGKWIQNSCDLQCPFVCYEEAKFVKKQTVRFYFTHDGEHSLTDSSLQTTILNKISEKLKSIGIGDYKSISWKKDEGGEVFHLSKRREFK